MNDIHTVTVTISFVVPAPNGEHATATIQTLLDAPPYEPGVLEMDVYTWTTDELTEKEQPT